MAVQDQVLKVIAVLFVGVFLLAIGVGAFTAGLYFVKTPPKMVATGADNPIATATTLSSVTTTTLISEATTTTTLSNQPTTTTTVRSDATTTTTRAGVTTTTRRSSTTTTMKKLGELVPGCSCSGSGRSCFENCGIPSGHTQGYYDCVDRKCYFTSV